MPLKINNNNKKKTPLVMNFFKILMYQFESACQMHYCVYTCYTYIHTMLRGVQPALAILVKAGRV